MGDVVSGLEDVIVAQNREIAKRPSSSQMELAIRALTAAIVGARGGAARLLDNDGDGVPDTLYIADNPDPNQAIKVWRFNYEGWGASKNGYNGPFVMGATFDAGLIADFITAGTLHGILVKAGKIESESGQIQIDLSSDSKPIFNTGITTKGLHIQNKDYSGGNVFSVEEVVDAESDVRYFNMSGYSHQYGTLFSLSENVGEDAQGVRLNMWDTEQFPTMSLGCAAGYRYLYLGQADSENQNPAVQMSSDDNYKKAKLDVAAAGNFCTLEADEQGVSLQIPGREKKYVYWESNGDGTYTLKGK